MKSSGRLFSRQVSDPNQPSMTGDIELSSDLVREIIAACNQYGMARLRIAGWTRTGTKGPYVSLSAKMDDKQGMSEWQLRQLRQQGQQGQQRGPQNQQSPPQRAPQQQRFTPPVRQAPNQAGPQQHFNPPAQPQRGSQQGYPFNDPVPNLGGDDDNPPWE